MKRLTLAGAGFLVALALPTPARAQAATAPAGTRGDLIAWLDDAQTKLTQLAEAIPQEKYSWRPGQGVRSVSEVFMHVASSNYYFPQFVGAQVQSPLGRDAENTVTNKAEVVASLKRAFDQMRTVMSNVRDADLDKTTSIFGRQSTYRYALLLAVTHAHEHLGQMIAYARSNGVVPPWSMAGN